MDKPAAIEKVKLLFNLASSAPENEANNAKTMAQKLIEKFSLCPEDYAEKEETKLYTDTDDVLLFSTLEFSDWKTQLAIIITNKYNCYVIEERNLASTGDTHYKYFVYGEENDIILSKELFKFVYNKIIELTDKLEDDGSDLDELYKNSYCEGVVSGVSGNIMRENFKVPSTVKFKEQPANYTLVKQESVKPPPPQLDVKPASDKKEKPLNIWAYFEGESDGFDLHIEVYDEGLEIDKGLIKRTYKSLENKVRGLLEDGED